MHLGKAAVALAWPCSPAYRSGYTLRMPEGRTNPELGGPLVFAALAVSGTLLAMLAVYVGTGLHDGFGDWDLHRIGRRFRRALLWALPVAAVAGILLHAYYRRLLGQSGPGIGMVWSVVRVFAHFPLYGMLVLLATLWCIVPACWRLVSSLRRRSAGAAEEEHESIFGRWLGPPLWFIMLPAVVLKLPSEGNMEIPETVSRRRLLRWLPAVLALLLLSTNAVSEDSGERVDPYWLAALASFWLADYLMVALRVAPVLRARRAASTA